MDIAYDPDYDAPYHLIGHNVFGLWESWRLFSTNMFVSSSLDLTRGSSTTK